MRLHDDAPQLVSILVPARNASTWISDAIQSAVRQSHPLVEVIVVDDGSTDETPEIVEAFADPRVRLIRQPSLGANTARNTALRVSRGDFIQYLDADDVLGVTKIEAQLRRLRSAPVGSVATCAWAHFERDDLQDAVFVPEGVWSDLSPIEWLVTSHMGGGMMPPHAWLVPRDVAEKAGLWAERPMRNQDGEFFARAVLASSGVAFTPNAKVYYRRQARGARHARSNEAVQGLLWAQESITTGLLQMEDSPRTRGAMATSFDRIAFDLYGYNANCAKIAARRARELGGSAFVLPGGGRLGRLAALIGWRYARRFQSRWARMQALWRDPAPSSPSTTVRRPRDSSRPAFARLDSSDVSPSLAEFGPRATPVDRRPVEPTDRVR